MKSFLSFLFWGLLVPALIVGASWESKSAYFFWFIAILFFSGSIHRLVSKIKKATQAPGGICPECRTPGAKSSFKGPRCPNPSCARYDPSLPTDRLYDRPTTPLPKFKGTFDPGENAIDVAYRNYQGEDRVFRGDRKSVRKGKNSFSLRVAPTGQRIRLLAKFLKNPSQLESLATKAPDKRSGPKGADRQVLSYHLKRGTTSPRFEEARRRFPDWDPR